MLIVKKNVYYCEFCKKKGLSRYHLKEHEESCTGNVNRYCCMCNNRVDYSPMIEKFKAQMDMRDTVSSDDYNDYHVFTVERKPDLAEIFESVEECPACVLTILRACGLCGHEWDMKFDWKTERDKWWADNKPPFDEEW